MAVRWQLPTPTPTPPPPLTIRESLKGAGSGLDLRKTRRVGIGAQAIGDLGFGGALLELNIDSDWGVTAGFGGGEGIQTYKLGAKYILTGEEFLPYIGMDFSHWSTLGKTGPIERTNPSIIGDHFLTGDERASGSYTKNFLVPAFGVQYIQLEGDWSGVSVFAELAAMLDIGDFLIAPTADFGFLYYF
jgi:hypothetical protein